VYVNGSVEIAALFGALKTWSRLLCLYICSIKFTLLPVTNAYTEFEELILRANARGSTQMIENCL
jgi:hypothetical protein